MNETSTDKNEIATERLKHVNEYAIQCINDEAKALTDLIPQLDHNFEKSVELIYHATARLL